MSRTGGGNDFERIRKVIMQKTNYQKQLEKILAEIKKRPEKPKLLLHACCAPCSSYVIEYLAGFFEITILYYNPNIYPEQEYSRRLEELKQFLPKFPPSVQNNVHLVVQEYNPQDFYAAVRTNENPELAQEKEKGERCRRCYEFRLRRAYEYAYANNFEWFTTTLSISPFKDAEKINTIGKQLEENPGPLFLTSDFKKNSGFKRSLEISAEYGLYRQQYCGCVYSHGESHSSAHYSDVTDSKHRQTDKTKSVMTSAL